MFKNLAQKAFVYAYDTANNVPKTGLTNITGKLSLDGSGTAVTTDDAFAQELDLTNHPGVYYFNLLATETDADTVLLTASTVTADIVIDPTLYFTRPQLFGDMQLDASGYAEAMVIGIDNQIVSATGTVDFDDLAAILTDTGTISALPTLIEIQSVLSEIWDKLTASHVTAGTFGKAVADAFGNTETIISDVSEILTDTGTTLPAQISSIGVASGAGLNFEAQSGVVAVGTPTNDYTATEVEDGTYHSITDASAITVTYGFSLSGIRKGVQAIWKGYVSGANDTITVQAYDYVGATWDTLGTISGQAGTNNVQRNFSLLSKHTGTGASAGEVQMRLTCTGQTTPTLLTDQILIEGVVANQTVGYEDGAIWVDTTLAVPNTNTTPFVDGVADNPVSTWAAALSISSATGITRFRIKGGSSITLTGSSTGYNLIGDGIFNLNCGDQILTDGSVVSAVLSGTALGSSIYYKDCSVAANFISGPAVFNHCGFNTPAGSPFVAGTFGQYLILDGYSQVPGSGVPYFDWSGTGGTVGINFRRWSGGTNFTLDSDCTLSLEVLAGGSQTITTGGGDVEIRGIARSLSIALTGGETVRAIGTFSDVVWTGTSTLSNLTVAGIASSVTNTTGIGYSSYNDYTLKDLTLQTIDSVVDNIAANGATEANVNTAIADIAALNDISAADVVTAVFANVVEGTYTYEEMIKLMGSALLGKLSGAATTTISIRDLADSKDRVVATVDADGNRSAITLDGA